MKHVTYYRRLLQFFRISKRSCVAISLSFLVTLLAFSYYQSHLTEQKIYYDPAIDSTYLKTVSKPHLEGINSNKQHYDVVADQSYHIDEHQLELYNIIANIERPNGSMVKITSDKGLYNKLEETLLLQENVHLVNADQKHFETEKAQVDLSTNRITCLTPVVIYDPQGNKTKAASCIIEDEGEKILFTGPVQSVTKQGK